MVKDSDDSGAAWQWLIVRGYSAQLSMEAASYFPAFVFCANAVRGFRRRASSRDFFAAAVSPFLRCAIESQTKVSSAFGSISVDFWKLAIDLTTSPPNIFGAFKYWRPRLASTRGLFPSNSS